MTHVCVGPAPAIPRLGIEPYQWGTICDHGDVFTGPATSFPQSLGMVCILVANDYALKHNADIYYWTCRQQVSTMTCYIKLLGQSAMK